MNSHLLRDDEGGTKERALEGMWNVGTACSKRGACAVFYGYCLLNIAKCDEVLDIVGLTEFSAKKF